MPLLASANHVTNISLTFFITLPTYVSCNVLVATPFASVLVAIVLVAAVLEARVSRASAILTTLVSRAIDFSAASIAMVLVLIVVPVVVVVAKIESVSPDSLLLRALIPSSATPAGSMVDRVVLELPVLNAA